MSDSANPNGELDSLTDQLHNSLISLDSNKPDFRELDLGSPVSPLRTRLATRSTSSSSGSGSGTNRSGLNPATKLTHSGELSTSSETSPSSNSSKTPKKPSSQSSVNSPVAAAATASVFPTGNICPSGRISRTNMSTPNRSSKTDVLGSGGGNYGHGSIMRGGGGGGSSSRCYNNHDAGTTTILNRGSNTGNQSSIILNSGSNTGNHCSSSMRGSNAGSQSSIIFNGGNSKGWGNVNNGGACGGERMDAEEVKKAGNDMYKKGEFAEAVRLYEKAIVLSPENAAYRSNRAAALMGLGRVVEAVRECEEAVRLEPNYWRAHQRLGSLLIRLGHVDNARKHLCYPGQRLDPTELQKLQLVEKHISRCSDVRKVNDWKSALRESDAAIAAGADYCPQLSLCRAEALLKLHQLEDAESSLSSSLKLEPYISSNSQTKFFGMLSEAYPFFVRAQIEMALGRFENAVTAAEKAGQIDPWNVEVAVLLHNVKLVSRARARGNDLFKSERLTEACSAYGEGLRLDPSNSVLYCNRAACWFKLGLWERSIDDCNQALRIQPNYTKALLRRATSNSKLERWADAVSDYEVLRRELPDDNEVAENLFHAQVALKKSRGEDVHNMKFGGEVEEVSGLEQFRAAISLPGISVVHFNSSSNFQCKQISPFVDILCSRYPSINFLKVDIEDNPAVANVENVRIVPTFKIYKSGSKVKEIVCPSCDMLEHSVRHYSF